MKFQTLILSIGLTLSVSNMLFIIGCATTNGSEESPELMPKVKHSMHPSWDSDKDGINDCEKDGSCDHTVDYSKPRPSSGSQTELAPITSVKPTFSCDVEGLSSAEKLICSDNSLAKFDLEMADTYKQALAKIDNEPHKKMLKAMQRGWIKGRNECWKESDLKECIKDSYIKRLAELEARYRLVDSSVAVFFYCEGNPSNEFVVTYFSTTPPTAIMERGDKSELLYREVTASGLLYSAGDYKLKEHNGKAKIQWGYNTADLNCEVKQ